MSPIGIGAYKRIEIEAGALWLTSRDADRRHPADHQHYTGAISFALGRLDSDDGWPSTDAVGPARFRTEAKGG